MHRFRKTGSPRRIDWEVAGLTWLADAGPQAAQVVPVVDRGKGWLEEPVLREVGASPQAAEDFGRALAFTHAAGASHFGAPPPSFSGSGWMGEATLPVVDHVADTSVASAMSWGTFYAEYRVLPYVASSPFTAQERAIVEKLCERLASGDLDHEQPALVSTQAARTHGDLWSGNVMWTATGAVLIDPAAQGGHAEEDLAQLGVFGCPQLDRIRAAYDEVSPLAPGWQERIALHQMHMLIIHCHLFGRSYVSQTVAAARRYVGPTGSRTQRVV